MSNNKLALFSTPQANQRSRSKEQVASLKTNCTLFSRPYIACPARQCNLDSFFEHENQGCPPSISDIGQLRRGIAATCATSGIASGVVPVLPSPALWGWLTHHSGWKPFWTELTGDVHCMLRKSTLRMQKGLQAPVQMTCIEFTLHITLQM